MTGGTVVATPVQQGFHRPDTTLLRWMGSIAGDVGNSTSTSAPLTQVVNAPGGTLACTPNPALSLQLVTCTLTVTVMGNAPTGYVDFEGPTAPPARQDGANPMAAAQ